MSSLRDIYRSSSRILEVEKPPLSTKRTYLEYVKSLCPRNPCLQALSAFLSQPKAARHNCQVAALDFRENVEHTISRSIADLNYLWGELQGTTKEDELYQDHRLQGRILIVEDLTRDVVELLGITLDIDPLFFALHLHTTHRTGMRHQTPDEATLPSRLLDQDYVNVSYHRPIECTTSTIAGGRFVRDIAIDRKLVFLRSTTIGLAQHCASIIKVQPKEDFWIAIILVDPPIGDTYYRSGHKDDESQQVHLQSRPFLGAYEDFLRPPKFSDDWTSLHDISRGGMADDLLHYWERCTPPSFERHNPTIESLAYYPLKIVAAEWVKYTAVMQHSIKQYEYQGEQLPDLDRFNADLRELQGWRRRSMNSQQKIRSITRQLQARFSPTSRGSSSLTYLIEDLEVINANIEKFGARLENMLPVVTSLVQIIDARHSFAETANITRLTGLALVFVPLNYIAAIFSMSNEFVPGGRLFWQYWAVAVPVALLILVIARPPMWIYREVSTWFHGNKQKRIKAHQAALEAIAKGKSVA
ncbi:hypothetical protein BDV96DRAFT_629937 [Lophiotrema nucula]|uniref:Cora-like Mg2+ transporter protein-domain-containing protein n=1 Tax=Lophiotrema nucula TaxID=690887 RepID=A0A6A5ZFZ8_9PLEO|nr:hypothetical protein BDV96DRAFT_629937 [Lophiotrema nucula]